MRLSKFAAAAALVLLAGSASAQILQDGVLEPEYGVAVATDPNDDSLGGSATDILGLYFAQDADYFYFALTGDAAPPDWGKWCLYIESSTYDPDTDAFSFVDSWGRNVSLGGTFAPQFQAHTWVDGGGGSGVDRWNGTAWVNSNDGTATSTSSTFGFSLANGVYEWRFRRAGFNMTGPGLLTVGGWTTAGGGSDPATDIVPGAGNTAAAGWGDPSVFNVGQPLPVTNVNDWNMY